jgi:hypothetical protein
MLYIFSQTMSYFWHVFWNNSNYFWKTFRSKLKWRSWSRCRENFARYSECLIKNRSIQCIFKFILCLRSRNINSTFSFIIDSREERLNAINLFTNLSMIVPSCETSNWRFMKNLNIMRLTRLLLMMIFRQTSYFLTATLTIEISFWNFFTIKTSLSNFDSILIFLSENDFHTKTRSFDKKKRRATEHNFFDFRIQKCRQIFVQRVFYFWSMKLIFICEYFFKASK